VKTTIASEPINLSRYAKFLLENYLDELVTLDLQKAREIQMPLLEHFKGYSEEEIHAYSKERFTEFLTDLQHGTALEIHNKNLQIWKNNEIPGLEREKVDVRDIVLSPYTRKFALIKLLKKFTQNLNDYEAIIEEIEAYYSLLLGSSLETYVEIHQETIKEQKDFLEAIINNTIDGISAYDHKLNVTLWNKSLEKRTGILAKDVLGKNAFQFFPNYQHSEDGKAMQKALKGETTHLRDMTYKDKPGYYESDLIPLFDSHHKPSGLIAVSRDITQRRLTQLALEEKNQKLIQTTEELKTAQEALIKLNKELEERVKERTNALNIREKELEKTLKNTVDLNHKLQQSEAKLKFMLEAIPQIVWTATPDGNVDYFNKRWYKYTGLEQKNSLNQNWNIAIHPDDLEKFIISWRHCVSNKSAFSMEYRLRCHLNQYKWFLAKAVPVLDDQGNFYKWFGTLTDIDENKQNQSAIKEVKEQLENIIQNSPIIIWSVDPQGIITLSQGKGLKSLGLKQGELVGKSVYEYPDNSPTFNSNIRKALAGESFTSTDQLKNLIIETYFSPLYDEQGNIKGMVGVSTDITAKKNAETERLKYENDLLKVNFELSKKNTELEKINTDLDNFIYVASHDLKAPIANLEGINNRLIKQLELKLEAKDKHLFKLSEDSINRLKKTIDDLTEISRTQKLFHEQEEEVVYFNEILSDFQHDMEDIILYSKAKIFADFQVPNIVFPRKNLRSIIYNLLSNAIKYKFPDRSPEIHIQTFWSEEKIGIKIKDNGLGLKDEQIPKMFSMFKRFHDHVDGSGIGLYIIKQIVDNNGGNIKVESKVNEGTLFTITLNSTIKEEEKF
jgi:PAS domain S-box-containing protein